MLTKPRSLSGDETDRERNPRIIEPKRPLGVVPFIGLSVKSASSSDNATSRDPGSRAWGSR